MVLLYTSHTNPLGRFDTSCRYIVPECFVYSCLSDSLTYLIYPDVMTSINYFTYFPTSTSSDPVYRELE